MVVDRLPGGVREFASYLDGLLARLDQGAGWSGVFWQRDPDGMRACLDGREVPPWDVVEALLEDLAAAYGSAAAAAERERARALYRAALTAYDARPGARDALLDRLDVMLREQRYAAERHAELARLLSAGPVPEDADSLRLDLAWAQDDHDRATARCAELRSRLTELDRRAAVRARGVRHRGETGPSWAAGGGGAEGVPAEVPPRFRQAERDGRAGEGERQWRVRRSGGTRLGEESGPPWDEGEDLEVRGRGAPAKASPPLRDTGRDHARRPAGPAYRSLAEPEPWAAGSVPGDARIDRPFSPTDHTTSPLAPGRDALPDDSSAPAETTNLAALTDDPTRAPHAAVPGRIPGMPASPQTPDTEASVWTPHPAASASAPHADSFPPQAAAPSPDAGQAAQTSLPAQAAAPSPGARQDGQQAPASSRTVRAPESPLPTHAPAAPTLAPRTIPGEPQAAAPLPSSSAPGKPRKRRRGSARFAGMVEEGAAAAVVVPPAAPAEVPEAPARRTPRGARFAGAGQAAEPAAAAPVEVVDAEAEVAVAGVVERLGRLRAEGRSGEAHVLLVEVVQWPPGRFPALADALHRAGLGADWATLLWETASLPAERLVAAADALTAAGREADGLQLLRQGVARPAEQIGAAVLRLEEEGRRREAAALLDAWVRGRTAEEAARSVVPDPRRLVPLLLHAARAVSEERHWDLVHALRVAGHTT
ncbi:hypothetical protein ABB07_06720 [Streptomyces incarnatus]|uniref:UL36 very large tegument protein n=1 Tax=Streptomyces incarnatus TaxID=665007 RepID=A0ABM5TFM6_9ACTN|nr:hypothetical protein [Streptomyces incarnatus]AKJ09725.1 hypothetical protein ABB07_06720 [Streptomyces incarnatus]